MQYYVYYKNQIKMNYYDDCDDKILKKIKK